jgi:alkylation response protein AidB-like acyl-CoA dehydrogenase
MSNRIGDPVRLAETIAAEVALPHSARWDRAAQWPEEAVRALQQCGLAGLVVPETHGGQGRGMLALLRVCEALGRADGSVALCYGMHCVGTACIAAKATKQQGEAFLRPIAEGTHWTTLALSEAGTGSHFYLPQTKMHGDTNAYVLEGTKCFVTNGGHADSYVVSTAVDGGAEPGEFSMVMVPAEPLRDR